MKLLLTGFCVLVINIVLAQENSVSAGGETVGSGGASSYSIGQTNYTFQTDGNINIIEGVQQPYEISVLEIKDFGLIENISVFPNPTTQFVTISIQEFEGLEFQLFDINGRLIQSGKLSNSETTINVSQLPQSTFLLNILKNNSIGNTFKIIKKD
ncbi:MAG: T9SS type A sorting domain-containing protein [Flavobacterium sp.]|nr:T9SS type A sorting domain-containing protein [Flavobacterium sp.]